MKENPQFLAMRERSLAKSGGMSFANVVHADTTSSLSSLNRDALLELVYQHLRAIGMNESADLLEKESGHTFQNSKQPWNRTDLQLLVSLAISHREDPWNIPKESNHFFTAEEIEEDNFAFPYREDTSKIWEELADPMINSVYTDNGNPTFANLKAASLKRIIVSLVTRQGTMQHLPDQDLQLVFLSLHSMTSSDHFLKHFVTLFDGEYPEEMKDKIEPVINIVRHNIVDVIKKWISFHGLFIGRHTLKSITQFLTRISKDEKYSKYSKITLQIIPNLTYGSNLGQRTEVPLKVSNPGVLFSPNLTILMPDADFVANQISTYQMNVFASVHSLEFINAFSNHKTNIQTPTLNEFFHFGRHLQILFIDSFLKENNPVQAYSKLIEIAVQLKECKNYDALYSLVSLIRREDMRTIGKCTPEQSNQIDLLWEECGKDGSVFENQDGKESKYEENIRSLYGAWKSCIPNLTAELHSIPKNVTDQSDFTEDWLINWEKKRKIAERAHIIYRFQTQSSFPPPVSQIQKVISSIPSESFDQLIGKIADKIDEMQDNK